MNKIIDFIKVYINRNENKTIWDNSNFYPEWVCQECGLLASGGRSYRYSTWHEGVCDVCEEVKPVTQPRDFYWPVFITSKEQNGKY